MPQKFAIVLCPRAGDRVGFAAKLPLSADASGVTSLLQEIPKGCFITHQCAEIQIVANIVASRHQLYASGCAQRLDIALLEAHPGYRTPIQF
jgi:hypothetical protein